MNIGFQYQGYNQSSEPVSGAIYADSADGAHAKLKRSSVRVSQLRFSLMDTLNGLSGQFDTRELVRFYRTIGKRLDAGKPIISGIEAAISFTTDTLLVNALRLMLQRVSDGAKLHDAMTSCGFNERDANVIRAADASGNQGAAFIRLAEDVERAHKLRSSIKSTFLPMKVLAFLAIVGTYVAMGWFSPKMIEFFEKWSTSGQGSSLPPLIVVYNKVAMLVAANKTVSGLLFGGVIVSAHMLFKSTKLQHIADQWKTWRYISEKSDHASAWTSFCLLYDSGGVSAYDAASIAKKSCQRADAREMFNQLDRALRVGMPLKTAVATARFPSYIVNGVHSAEEGGSSTVDGLQSMVTDLEQDVDVMTDILKIKIVYLSQAFGGLIVLLFFYVTLFPIFSQIGQKI